MTDSTIIKMGYVIEAYLKKEQLQNAKPKDLMPILIENGFFTKDHRNGLPLRNILRTLDKENKLHLLPQVTPERKETNTFWFFNSVN